jgi:hypothetical protein
MENNTLLANVPVDLLYQALETEKGGVQIYSTALRYAVNKDLIPGPACYSIRLPVRRKAQEARKPKTRRREKDRR